MRLWPGQKGCDIAVRMIQGGGISERVLGGGKVRGCDGAEDEAGMG